VAVYRGGERHSFLFDTGYSPIGVPHNLVELDLDLKDIEAIILSHGHMDHTGALYPVLESLSRPMPLVVHPEAFHSPRYFGLDDGRKLLFPSTLKREELTGAGAEIVESEGPVLLGNDTVLVTGEVERVTPFEKGLPNALLERDGKEEKDPILDDQSLVVHLKDKGLVIISGCAHAGIVNTVLYGRKLTGVEKIHTVIGGFHLSGPVFEPIIEETIEAFREMDLDVIVPMHCTGWKAIERFSEAFPSASILNSVGSRFTLA
jgi:7,8-dihydropterin-6-yl-methyl-4-(beta-D-ribofuranosyl)aminobenzene 5'-phosphate synthase